MAKKDDDEESKKEKEEEVKNIDPMNLIASEIIKRLEKGATPNYAEYLPLLAMRNQGNDSNLIPMMMMFMMMNQNQNQQKSNDLDMNSIIKMKIILPMLDDLGGGRKLSPVEQKMLENLSQQEKNKEIKDLLDMYLKEQQHRDEIREAREQERMKQSSELQDLKEELADRLERLEQSKNKGIVEQMREFAEFKKSFDQAYEILNPEAKKTIPPPNEQWTTDDYITATKSILDAIPGLVTAIRGVSGSIKPPKKEIKEMPIVPKKEIPKDPEVERYFDQKNWTYQQGQWVDPYNHVWTDDQGHPMGPEEMRKAFENEPEEAKKHVETVKKEWEEYLRKQKEEQEKTPIVKEEEGNLNRNQSKKKISKKKI
ncbi:MAG: OmpH family outer membrane protein [Candidatus Parvarchaeota archaeon]